MRDQGRRCLERNRRLSLNFADQSRIDDFRTAGFSALRRNASDHYLQNRFDYVITRLSRTLHRLCKRWKDSASILIAVIIIIDQERYLQTSRYSNSDESFYLHK